MNRNNRQIIILCIFPRCCGLSLFVGQLTSLNPCRTHTYVVWFRVTVGLNKPPARQHRHIMMRNDWNQLNTCEPSRLERYTVQVQQTVLHTTPICHPLWVIWTIGRTIRRSWLSSIIFKRWSRTSDIGSWVGLWRPWWQSVESWNTPFFLFHLQLGARAVCDPEYLMSANYEAWWEFLDIIYAWIGSFPRNDAIWGWLRPKMSLNWV